MFYKNIALTDFSTKNSFIHLLPEILTFLGNINVYSKSGNEQ